MSEKALEHLGFITRFELPICRILNGVRNRPILLLLSIVSRLGNGWLWGMMGLALLAFQGFSALPTIRHLVFAFFACFALYKLLKNRTARPRPFTTSPGFHLTVAPLDEFSFPSGHTLYAVAFTLVLYSHSPVAFWVMLPFTLLIALSRVVLGLHYPSDVVAGAMAGSLVALAVLQL